MSGGLGLLVCTQLLVTDGVWQGSFLRSGRDEAPSEGHFQDSLVSTEESEKGDDKRKGLEKRS